MKHLRLVALEPWDCNQFEPVTMVHVYPWNMAVRRAWLSLYLTQHTIIHRPSRLELKSRVTRHEKPIYVYIYMCIYIYIYTYIYTHLLSRFCVKSSTWNATCFFHCNDHSRCSLVLRSGAGNIDRTILSRYEPHISIRILISLDTRCDDTRIFNESKPFEIFYDSVPV